MVRLDFPDGTWAEMDPMSGDDFEQVASITDAQGLASVFAIIRARTIRWSGEGPITSRPYHWLADAFVTAWMRAEEASAVPEASGASSP